ncbi:hypothetical protein HMPREF1549_02661 [Actinomyces johnsonii F0510]|uniref:Uncharacterized protein n=1 Tax=Actinomyces johnsonii F0510 TaxID=1227262 RepID=U1PI43_9ACTO|nr:hypothetical protein HMPREF1549_02661 [Actinomyces johnsonii F0510]
MRRTGFKRLGLSPLSVRQRRLALSAHAHSTLAEGAHHHRAGLGQRSRHGAEHSGRAAVGATSLVHRLGLLRGGRDSPGRSRSIFYTGK